MYSVTFHHMSEHQLDPAVIIASTPGAIKFTVGFLPVVNVSCDLLLPGRDCLTEKTWEKRKYLYQDNLKIFNVSLCEVFFSLWFFSLPFSHVFYLKQNIYLQYLCLVMFGMRQINDEMRLN